MSDLLTRRSVVIQLAALGLAACGGDKGGGATGPLQPGGSGDDTATGGGDSGGSGGDSGGTGTGDDTGTASGDDTGGSGSGDDTGEAPADPCEVEPTTFDEPPSITEFHGEGPNYRSGQPETDNLNVRGETGTKLWVRGQVFDRNGKPLVGARVDAWQVDQAADYNLEAEDFHGHGYQYTDDNGAYCFVTLRPPPIFKDDGDPQTYAHIHFKLWWQGEQIETFQLAFADDPYLYTVDVPAKEDTVREVEETGPGEGVVRFDIVLDVEQAD